MLTPRGEKRQFLPRFSLYVTDSKSMMYSLRWWVARVLILVASIFIVPNCGASESQSRKGGEDLCALASNPQRNEGKRITVRGRVYEALGRIYVRSESCPESVRVTLSRTADPKAAERLSQFRRFVTAQVRRRTEHATCAACNRYRVEATLSGQVSIETQHAAGSVQQKRTVLNVDDVIGVEAEDLYGSFYSAAEYEPTLQERSKK